MTKIMVLNDGETFTDLTGCILAEVSEEILAHMEDGVKFTHFLEDIEDHDVKIIAEFK